MAKSWSRSRAKKTKQKMKKIIHNCVPILNCLNLYIIIILYTRNSYTIPIWLYIWYYIIIYVGTKIFADQTSSRSSRRSIISLWSIGTVQYTILYRYNNNIVAVVSRFESVVWYTVVRGNHDYTTRLWGKYVTGSFRGNTAPPSGVISMAAEEWRWARIGIIYIVLCVPARPLLFYYPCAGLLLQV